MTTSLSTSIGQTKETWLSSLLGINAFCQGTFIGGAVLFAVVFDRLANYRRNT